MLCLIRKCNWPKWTKKKEQSICSTWDIRAVTLIISDFFALFSFSNFSGATTYVMLCYQLHLISSNRSSGGSGIVCSSTIRTREGIFRTLPTNKKFSLKPKKNTEIFHLLLKLTNIISNNGNWIDCSIWKSFPKGLYIYFRNYWGTEVEGQASLEISKGEMGHYPIIIVINKLVGQRSPLWKKKRNNLQARYPLLTIACFAH